MNKARVYLLEVILVFGSWIFLTWKTLLPMCFLYKNTQFDALNLLLWDYTALKSLIPEKNIFYPYGILSYLKNVNIFDHIITLILFFIVLFLFLYAFKSIFRSSSKAIIAFLGLTIFIHVTVNTDIVTRYGLLIGLAFLFSKAINKKNMYIILLSGVVSGCLLMIMPDIGIYSFILYTLGLTSIEFLSIFNNEKLYLLNYLKKIGLFFISFAIGTSPFIIYFTLSKTMMSFFSQFIYLKDLSLIAKTPFIPSLRSPENIFTISALILSISYLSFYFLYFKKKNSLAITFQIFLTLSLILLEQKSIIRSIDTQLTLFSFMLYILLFYELKNYFLYVISSRIFLGVISFLFLCSLFLLRPANYLKEGVFSIQPNQCINKNLTQITSQNKSYAHVINFFKKQKDFNNKIFSFPGDPVFYIFLNQNPPFFTDIYAASSKEAQKIQIDYIKRNRIKYIIFNSATKEIEDGVPDVIRGSTLYPYIVNNFYPIASIDSFLILKKIEENHEFFTDLIAQNSNGVLNYFTNIDFRTIPFTEGIYKYKNLKKEKRLFLGSTEQLQIYLNSHIVSSKNSFLVLHVTSKLDSNNTFSITTEQALKTNITFATKRGTNNYIFDLSKLPIFYSPKNVARVDVPKSIDSSELFSVKSSLYW